MCRVGRWLCYVLVVWCRQSADSVLVAASPGNPLKADEVCSLRLTSCFYHLRCLSFHFMLLFVYILVIISFGNIVIPITDFLTLRYCIAYMSYGIWAQTCAYIGVGTICIQSNNKALHACTYIAHMVFLWQTVQNSSNRLNATSFDPAWTHTVTVTLQYCASLVCRIARMCFSDNYWCVWLTDCLFVLNFDLY